MTRTARIALSTGVSLGVAAMLAAPSGAGSDATRATSATGPKLIKLISITTSERLEDNPPKGESVGDRLFATSRLLNGVRQFGRKVGAVVGTDSSWLTQVTRRSVTVDGTTRLPGGTLRFKGAVRVGSGGITTIPVVSGTGVFAGAVGTLTIGASDDGKVAPNIYRLTYALIA